MIDAIKSLFDMGQTMAGGFINNRELSKFAEAAMRYLYLRNKLNLESFDLCRPEEFTSGDFSNPGLKLLLNSLDPAIYTFVFGSEGIQKKLLTPILKLPAHISVENEDSGSSEKEEKESVASLIGTLSVKISAIRMLLSVSKDETGGLKAIRFTTRLNNIKKRLLELDRILRKDRAISKLVE